MLTLLASARLLHRLQLRPRLQPQPQRQLLRRLQPRPLQHRQTLRLRQCHLARSTCPGPIVRTTKPGSRCTAQGMAAALSELRLLARMSPRMPTPDCATRLHIALGLGLSTLEAIQTIRILRVPKPTTDTPG